MIEKNNLRIVFMGTPEFALTSLQSLVETNYNVVGVVTMPDKPAGRGYKLKASPIKEYALKKGLHLMQPTKLKDPDFLQELSALQVDLQIVVAFRMLPEVVWNMPSLGTFNLHASLLPQYRGAAPINWAIINGEKETGITTFFLTHKIDTGNLIFQETVPIHPNDNVEIIHDILMEKGAELVLKTVTSICKETYSTIEQKERIGDEELKPAPKIFKETCHIDWKKKANQVHNHIRGLSPYPSAWTEIVDADGNRKKVKIYRTQILNEDLKNKSIGQIVSDNKTYLKVVCKEGALLIEEIQLSGKKKMKILDFLRGFSLEKSSFD